MLANSVPGKTRPAVIYPSNSSTPGEKKELQPAAPFPVVR